MADPEGPPPGKGETRIREGGSSGAYKKYTKPSPKTEGPKPGKTEKRQPPPGTKKKPPPGTKKK